MVQSLCGSLGPEEGDDWLVGIRCSFRVPGSLKYRTYRFYGPTLPLAIPSAMWFSLSQLRPSQLSDRCALSSSSAFLQSLTNVS
jgi:hypothetical protein